MAHHYSYHKTNTMVKQLENILEKNLENGKLTNKEIAADLRMSERNFTRKVRKLTGKSANEFIRAYRLEKAMEFIQEGTYLTVNELSNAVGFASPGYFSHIFEEHYEKKPLELLRDEGWR